MSAAAKEDGLLGKKRELTTEVAAPHKGFAEIGAGEEPGAVSAQNVGLSHPHIPRGDGDRQSHQDQKRTSENIEEMPGVSLGTHLGGSWGGFHRV